MLPREKRRLKERGLSLAEIAVALGILLLLMGLVAPFFLNYRGKNRVNRAQELTRALVERAAEQAKTDGYPLPDELKSNGVIASAAAGSTPGSELRLRIKRRLSSDQPTELLSDRELSTGGVVVEFSNLGLIDLEGDATQVGYYLEFVEKTDSATTVLATLPIDVNGEFVLLGNAPEARLRYSFRDYGRELLFRTQGTVTQDRR